MESQKQEVTIPLHFQERREEIKRIIETLGIWNINKTQLANRYSVSRQTIIKDFKQLLKGVPKEDLEEIKFNLKIAHQKSISEAQKILATSPDNIEKIRAAMAISYVGEKFTKMLENYGLKDKIADKIETTQNFKINFEIIKP